MMKPFIIQEKQETVHLWINNFNNDEGKFNLYNLVVLTSVSVLDIYIYIAQRAQLFLFRFFDSLDGATDAVLQ